MAAAAPPFGRVSPRRKGRIGEDRAIACPKRGVLPVSGFIACNRGGGPVGRQGNSIFFDLLFPCGFSFDRDLTRRAAACCG